MRIHKRRGTILISIDVSLKNPALAGICTLKQWTELKSTLTSSGFFLFCFLVIIHEHLYLKAFSRCPITHSDLQFFSPPNMKSFYLSLQCFSATKARAGRFWNASPHLALLANNDKVAIPQIQVVSQLCRSAKGRWWELWQVALFTVHSHIRPFAPPPLQQL